MFNVSIFFFFQSVLLVTIIFWVLSILGEKFFKSNSQEISKEIFECGFFVVSNLRLRFNYNFFILGLLLILYDIEFFLLVPLFFNLYTINVTIFIVFWFFICSILFSFAYDWQNAAFTNWVG